MPPTYGAPVETAWTGSGTPKTMAQTWNTGDLVVVLGIAADVGTTLTTPTFAGGTFAGIGSAITTASSCWAHKWSVEATSSGSGNISIARTGNVNSFGAISYVFAAGTHGGIGNHTAPAANTTQTVSFATNGNDSAVIMAIGDWGAGTDFTSDWVPSGFTEREASTDTGAYSVYVADWANRGAAGTVSYGISVTASGQNYSKILVEVLTAPPPPDEIVRNSKAMDRMGL